MESEYPKLVRDRIPEIVEKDVGAEPSYRILEDDAEFLNALLKKATEEAAELQRSVETENSRRNLPTCLRSLTQSSHCAESLLRTSKPFRSKNGRNAAGLRNGSLWMNLRNRKVKYFLPVVSEKKSSFYLFARKHKRHPMRVIDPH